MAGIGNHRAGLRFTAFPAHGLKPVRAGEGADILGKHAHQLARSQPATAPNTAPRAASKSCSGVVRSGRPAGSSSPGFGSR